MLELLTLFGVAVVGSFFWLVSPEVMSAVYGAEGRWSPLTVGLVCATAQTCVYVFLYRGGQTLVQRWSWLNQMVERTRQRFARGLEERYLGLVILGAIFGIPPILVMVTLASGFQIRMSRVLMLAFVGRTIRFGSLAALGETAKPYLSGFFGG